MPREASQENRALQRIPELDGLRGIAIGLVVYFHFVIGRGLALPYPFGWFNRTIGQTFCCGVDLFFVLSGFLIGGILLDSRESGRYFSTFYMRRACRIIPIYLLIVGGFMTVLAILGRDFHLFRSLTIGRVFNPPMPWYVYTTFTQNFYMGMKQTYGVFCSPCWSLAVEEQFYLTLPFLVRFVPRRWIGAVIGVLLVACVSARSYLYITGGINSVQFITLPFCRADGLLIGVSCALLVRNDRVRQYLVRTPAVLYGLAVLFGGASFYMLAGKWRAQDRADMTTDFTLWALFFASILLISVLHPGSPVCKPLRFKPLMKLGTIAYCLYLIHDSVRDVTVAVANRNGDPGLGVTWISIGVGITISIALASLSWVAYEKWFIRIGRRFNYAAPQTARHNATLVALVPEEASVPQQMS